ncbi:ATP-dependent helicase [Candidatus Phytoplasma fraxini]|uniref:DNA 3'-5' helicase n=1 Tax=Ash yellows phytoplasma TaxID=35780 RepID=A0ABZ2U8V3_ASHYP
MERHKWLNNLNKEQIDVITSNEQNIYLQAGAGTGKTTTLTTKIIHFINELNIKGNRILAVTFTNNAAQEMKERLKKMIPSYDLDCLMISTFHAFGYSFLKKHIHQLNSNFNSLFDIIDEQKSKKIIKEQINVLNLDKNKYNVPKLQKKILKMKNDQFTTRLRNELMSEDTYFNINKNLNFYYKKEEEQIFSLYNDYLKKNNLLDFDDLIIYTCQLLQNNLSLASTYRNKFSHIFVDEFQDIDLIQYQIIKIIGMDNFVFVVGDPNQTIYSFRGSDAICNELFVKDFKAKIFYLKQNYRSTQKILDKANLLIQHNYNEQNNHFRNDLQSTSSSGEKVVYKSFMNSKQEAKFISNKIIDLVKSQKYNYKDIAVLYRVNMLSAEIENSFLIHNIPYIIKSSMPLYQKKEIKDFISYLKVFLFNKNDFDFKRIINVPQRQIGKKTIIKLEQIAAQNNISLFEALDYISDDDNIKTKIENLKKIFQKLLDFFNDEQKCNLSNVIDGIDEILQYSNLLDKKKDNNNKEKIKDKLTYLQKIFIEEDKKKKEGTFLEKLSLLLNEITLYNEKSSDDNKSQVLLSSIHKVKGLEFKIIFSIGWESNIFHNDNLVEDDILDKYQEERRIAYVAITRAKELLYLTSAKTRFYSSGKIISKPVSFVQEMKLISENFVSTDEKIFIKRKWDKQILKNKPINKELYKVGDKIMHNIFGKGSILSINEDILTIVFSKPYGIKKILMNHCSWKKI